MGLEGIFKWPYGWRASERVGHQRLRHIHAAKYCISFDAASTRSWLLMQTTPIRPIITPTQSPSCIFTRTPVYIRPCIFTPIIPIRSYSYSRRSFPHGLIHIHADHSHTVLFKFTTIIPTRSYSYSCWSLPYGLIHIHADHPHAVFTIVLQIMSALL